MWRATVKSLLARKLRLALTAVAVVLGVGFMAGTLIITDTALDSFDGLFGDVYKGTDVVVQAKTAFTPDQGGPGGGGGQLGDPIPADVLSKVEAVPGVRAVNGDVSGLAEITDPVTGDSIHNGGAPTIGNSWDPAVTSLIVAQGSAPSGSTEVLIDAGTASDHHLSVGQRLQIVTSTGSGTYTISGIGRYENSDSLLGATLAIFDLPTAQKLFGMQDEYSYIYVASDPGVTPVQLASRVQNALPNGFEAVTSASAAETQTADINKGLGFLRTALLVFAFVSLFVGAFIIFNTFNIVVTQRTRELALLRALGAGRGQVMASVLSESVLVGFVASLVGVGVGLGLAVVLRGLLSALGLKLPSGSLVIAPRTFIVSLAVGTIITGVAALSPARRASRVSPIEALTEGAAPPTSMRRRVIAGSIVTVAGVAALLGGLFGGVSNAGSLVGLGAMLTFIGVAMLSPLVTEPLGAVLGAPLRRALPGRLGLENAKRNPRRTASTSSALMIGLGLVVFVSVFAASLRASVTATLDAVLRADYTLSTTSFQPFSPQVSKEVGTVPGIEATSPLRQAQVKLGTASTFMVGIDPAGLPKVANVTMESGSLGGLSADGTVIVSSGAALTKHLSVGDTLTATFSRTGAQQLKVVGVFEQNSLLNDYATSLSTFEANVAQQLDFVVFVKVAPGANATAVKQGIDTILKGYPNVQVSDQSQFKEKEIAQIDQIFSLVFGLLVLSVIISLFGIVNTLALSIYERIRELGLLRAVGMSRKQVRRMIRSEAVVIALIGAILGLAIGVAFGWAMQRALADQGVSRLSLPVGQLVLMLVVAGLLGVVAAIWPARRAAKIDVLQAISYE
ncbi:MAG: putative transport system permease protein [Actinomycetota bacterium]|jgi:putative ABC transport system permease protein|nr:putative transport system permease protein [Actinomycetota bacterium]